MDPRHLAVIVSMESFARDGARPAPDACDLSSGADLAESLRRAGHRAQLVHADRDLEAQLSGASFDGAILALHGTLGGTGAIQGVLAEHGVPWVGPSGPATALAFDKHAARQVLAYQNLPVPTWVALAPDAPLDHERLALLGSPCVLKPRRSAHAAGVSVLHDATSVRHAVDRAICLDEHLLLERCYRGIEVQVALLDGAPLGAAEIDREATDPLDPQRRGRTLQLPPRLGRGRTDGLERLAARAARVLGLCRGFCRIDFIVDPHGNEVILEAEPLPSLHRHASVACIARAAGMDHVAMAQALAERLPAPTSLDRRIARPGTTRPVAH